MLNLSTRWLYPVVVVVIVSKQTFATFDTLECFSASDLVLTRQDSKLCVCFVFFLFLLDGSDCRWLSCINHYFNDYRKPFRAMEQMFPDIPSPR